MNKIYNGLFHAVFSCLLINPADVAAYKSDIDFDTLQTEQGNALATGQHIEIVQVEASSAGENEEPVYYPNAADPEFVNVNFVDKTQGVSTQLSGHATSMARSIVGETQSMTPGVQTVNNYEVIDWINRVLFAGVQKRPQLGNGRLANHSWVAAFEDAAITLEVLRRIDWLVDNDNFIQVAGYTGGTSPVLSHAYNVIAVRHLLAPVEGGSAAIDALYVGGRSLPHVTVPAASPSSATAIATSAVALLMDDAHPQTLPNELLKALLMAGADRNTDNSARGDIVEYRHSAQHVTDNGLDIRYGAGQLNIYNSYKILQGGQQSSIEAGSDTITEAGYDVVSAFGGDNGSAEQTRYAFYTHQESATLKVSLNWNLKLEEDGVGVFNPSPVLYNLDLQLVDVTQAQEVIVAQSKSQSNNNENLWLALQPNKKYQLRVLNGQGIPFQWDYALAWQIERTPREIIPFTPLLFKSLLLLIIIAIWRFRVHVNV